MLGFDLLDSVSVPISRCHEWCWCFWSLPKLEKRSILCHSSIIYFGLKFGNGILLHYLMWWGNFSRGTLPTVVFSGQLAINNFLWFVMAEWGHDSLFYFTMFESTVPFFIVFFSCHKIIQSFSAIWLRIRDPLSLHILYGIISCVFCGTIE